MLTITTEHLPELQCFVTIILCRNVHVFCHRTGAKGLKRQHFCKKFCSPGTFQVRVKQVCYIMFSKKMCSKANIDHILVQKAQS